MTRMFKPLFPLGHVVSQRINALADIEIIENNIISSILNVIHAGSRAKEDPTWIQFNPL